MDKLKMKGFSNSSVQPQSNKLIMKGFPDNSSNLIGKYLKQRDSGEIWEIIDIKEVPERKKTLVILKPLSGKNASLNLNLDHLMMALKTKNSPWSLLETKQHLTEMKVQLNIRKTLDGNLIIRDHPEIDIILSPLTKKVIILPKETMNEDLYPIHKRFFGNLRRHGIITLGSESSGFIHNSFEALYVESQVIDSISVLLKYIYQWIQEEKTTNTKQKEYEDNIERELLNPDEDKTTEFGEIPHKQLDGSEIKDPYYNMVSSWFGWRY